VRHVLLVPALALVALAPATAARAPAPRFDPLVFFDGTSEGDGQLKVLLHKRQSVRVQSRGHVEPDGTLVLVQRVEQAGKPPRTRHWRIREVAPGRYAGTLSDAAGPITGETHGSRLHLAFRMKGGLAAEQWLDLAPDGRSASNVLTVRKFGLRVAVLHETIRRTSPVQGTPHTHRTLPVREREG